MTLAIAYTCLAAAVFIVAVLLGEALKENSRD